MRHVFKKYLSVVLAIVMLISLVPDSAWADEQQLLNNESLDKNVVDTTAPVVHSLSVSSDPVTAPGSFTISGVVTDDISGVSSLSICLRNSNNNYILCGPNESDIAEDGSFCIAVYIDKYQVAGDYYIKEISCADNCGNRLEYSSINMLEAFNSVCVRVIDIGDTTAPVLHSLSVSPEQITAPGTVNVSGVITDDKAGFNNGALFFINENGKQIFVNIFATDIAADGSFSKDISITNQGEGTYCLHVVNLCDNINNHCQYNVDDMSMPEKFNEVCFSIVNDNEDTVAPELQSITLSPKQITAPGMVTVSGVISDDISGVNNCSLHFLNENGKEIFVNIYSTDIAADGSFSKEIPITYQAEGIYSLWVIYLSDCVGNSCNYNVDDMSMPDKFKDVRFSIVNGNEDTTAPVLQSIAVSPVNISAPGTVNISGVITDDKSGLNHGTLFFLNGDRKQIFVNIFPHDLAADGSFSKEIPITHQAEGTYSLWIIDLSDKVYNSCEYNVDAMNMPDKFKDISFTVEGVIDAGTCGLSAEWKLSRDGKLTIFGTGAMYDYSCTEDGNNWTSTAPWIEYKDSITSVEIQEGVTSVGKYAFMDCTNVETIEFPDSLKAVKEWAFRGCTSTSKIQLPSGLERIGAVSFASCESLTTVTIPGNVRIISSQSFKDCYSLSTVVIEDGVEVIGDYAFAYCNSLDSISIPNSIVTIDSAAFSYCTSLTEINLPSKLENIGSQAFYNCTGLRTIYLPEGITTIDAPSEGFSPFKLCSSDLILFCGAATAKPNWGGFWNNTDNNTKLKVFWNISKDDYDSLVGSTAHGSCGESVIWSLSSDGVLTISGTGAMTNYSNDSSVPWDKYRGDITAIVISEGVTSIGSHAFNNCSKVTEIRFPESITEIGDYATTNCNALRIFVFKGSAPTVSGLNGGYLTLIAYPEAYANEYSTILYVLNPLVKIGYGGNLTDCGFCGTTHIWVLDSTGKLTTSGNMMYDYSPENPAPWYKYRDSIIAIKAIGNIGDYAFCDLDNVVDISESTLKDSSTGSYCFADCDSLKSVTIPEYGFAGEYYFCGCDALESVTFVNQKTIQRGVFKDCISLNNLKFINCSPTDIKPYAFYNCSSLEYSMCGGCTNIGEYAFYNSAIKKVHLNAPYISGSGYGTVYLADNAFAGLPEDSVIEYHGHNVATGYSLKINEKAYDHDKTTLYYFNSDINIGTSVSWKLRDDGTLIISGSGKMKDSENNFQFSSFWYRYSGIKKVIIEDGVESVGAYAFFSLPISEVQLSNSINTLGNKCFGNCTNLSSINIPSLMLCPGEGPFSGCSKLKTLGPDNTYNIYYQPSEFGCVYQNMGLEKVVLSSSTTKIGMGNIKDCASTVEFIFLGKVPDMYSSTFATGSSFINLYYLADCNPQLSPGVTTEYGSAIRLVEMCHLDDDKNVVTEHTSKEVPGAAPTCTKDGITDGAYCDVCGKIITAQQVDPATGHSPKHNERIEPTCTETGTAEHWYCNNCKKIFSDSKCTTEITAASLVIPAKNHDYAVAYEWSSDCKSCIATATCKNDKTHVETETVNTTGEQKTAPTCTEKGTTTYTATFQNSLFSAQTKDAEDISPTNHDYAITYEWPADCKTCTATAACKNNGTHIETETVNTTGQQKVAPTCTGKGTTTYTATFLNSLFSVQTKDAEDISPINHDYVVAYEWSVDCKTCTATATCENDKSHVETEAVNTTGEQKTAPTCTEKGTTTYTATFKNSLFSVQTKDAEDIEAKGHTWDKGVVISKATPEQAGIKKFTCTIEGCGATKQEEYEYSENIVTTDIPAGTVAYVDGRPVIVGENGKIEITDANAKAITTYTTHVASDDPHEQYPTSMTVYIIGDDGSGNKVAEHVSELDNCLQYSGSSIRITGKKGIRMITSVPDVTRNSLISGSLKGYTLEEYGTLLAWNDQLGGDAPTLDNPIVKSNYAYKRGVSDPIFAKVNGLTQYTNVLTFDDMSKCVNDLAMRPYMKLSKDGDTIVLYGGVVIRNVGYIAWQNRNAFPAGTDAYKFIHSIIDYVYPGGYKKAS